MSQYITLLGAEDVRTGGNRMVEAAGNMRNVVGEFEDSLRRHRQFMDEWLEKFEQILAEHRP